MGNKRKLLIYTDGACSKNPGPGGWSSIAMFDSQYKILSGYEEETTNNRMELKAVIQSIKVWGQKYNLTIKTDSKYVKDNYYRWKSNWMLKRKGDVKNKDLWDELFKYSKGLDMNIEYCKAHCGIIGNEIADTIAVSMYKLHKSK